MLYEYYYTYGYEPNVCKYRRDKWMLAIHYVTIYDQNVKKDRAQSCERKFQRDDIPTTFDSFEHAMSYSKQFHNHVEEKGCGNCSLKKHVESTSSSKNIIGIQQTNRAKQ